MRRPFAFVVTAASAAVVGVIAVAFPAQADSLPVQWNWSSGFLGNLGRSGTAPLGANDFGCRSTDAKLPVILVHGTYEQQRDNWAAMSPFLKNHGYCVFTLNYGGRSGDLFWGYKSIADGAAELAAFVDTVRA